MQTIIVQTPGPQGPKGDIGPQGPTGSFNSTTESITINNVLTLVPQSPLPLGVPTGSFAVTSSIPPKPYFWDGTTWNALY